MDMWAVQTLPFLMKILTALIIIHFVSLKWGNADKNSKHSVTDIQTNNKDLVVYLIISYHFAFFITVGISSLASSYVYV